MVGQEEPGEVGIKIGYKVGSEVGSEVDNIMAVEIYIIHSVSINIQIRGSYTCIYIYDEILGEYI